MIILIGMIFALLKMTLSVSKPRQVKKDYSV